MTISNADKRHHNVYNENEVKEQRDIQNIKAEDKIWIDLVDPTDNDLESFVEISI